MELVETQPLLVERPDQGVKGWRNQGLAGSLAVVLHLVAFGMIATWHGEEAPPTPPTLVEIVAAPVEEPAPPAAEPSPAPAPQQPARAETAPAPLPTPVAPVPAPARAKAPQQRPKPPSQPAPKPSAPAADATPSPQTAAAADAGSPAAPSGAARPAAEGSTSAAGQSAGASGASDKAVPAAVLDNPRPFYPPAARKRGMQGAVMLAAEIDEEGKVVSASVETSSGFDLLDQAALDGIRRWRFRPAQRHGQAVRDKVMVPVRFELTAG